MTVLTLTDVSIRVTPEGPLIVDSVNLVLVAGTLTALQGRSGSGKTTLFNAILGWLPLAAGRIELAGSSEDLAQAAWQTVTVVPQTSALFPELTVEENLEAASRFSDIEAGWPIDDLMERLDLAKIARRPTDQISLGEQQRCAIARALTPGPQLLLADEPLASQDAGHAAKVLETLQEACRRGTACLVASHDPLVLAYADAVIRLDEAP